MLGVRLEVILHGTVYLDFERKVSCINDGCWIVLAHGYSVL